MHFTAQTHTGPSFADVKAAAQGRWPDILPSLGVALPSNGKHAPCPGCGGKDRFRFDNQDGDGTFICSQGGGEPRAGDGFTLLQHALGWDAATALREVADIVGVNATPATGAAKRKATSGEMPSTPSGGEALVATYIYRDRDGKPCLGIERLEAANGKKTFRQFVRRNGRKVYSVKDIEKLPYRLETWGEQAHTQIWLCEGEKDADRLGELGLRATTNPGGAAAWPDELTPYFAGYDVLICEDNDEAGRKRSALLTRKLLSVADSVKVIRLEGLEEKGDVSDWLDTGHTLDDLLDVAKAAAPATWHDASRFKWLDVSRPLDAVLDGNWLIKGVLPAHGVGVLYGRPGSGKTFVALDLALHIAARKPWRAHITKGGGTAYVAMEGGPATVNRVVAWRDEHDAAPKLLLTKQAVDLRSSHDDADALIEELREHNRRDAENTIRLVVIDTLNIALAGGNENDSQDMGAFVTTVKHIADALACFVLVVHHSGKDEARGSRGHSSLLGAVDTELEVKREQGAPGLMRVTKQRDGEDGTEHGFELKPVLMGIDGDMEEVWTCVAVEADAAAIHKARRQARGPTGRNQRRLWDAMAALEKDATTSPGVLGIPEGVLLVNESNLQAAFVATLRDEKPDIEDRRANQSFERARDSMVDGQPAWLKRKGGNLWKA